MSQLRRPMKPQPACMGSWHMWPPADGWNVRSPCRIAGVLDRCPYGVPGDVLWVREAHAFVEPMVNVDGRVCGWKPSELTDRGHVSPIYRASPSGHLRDDVSDVKWRPSIHMPRWACRLRLEVIGVRVERLQDISGEDVLAEGVGQPYNGAGIADAGGMTPEFAGQLRDRFRDVWGSIYANKPGLSWGDNPWVWAITFRRIPT